MATRFAAGPGWGAQARAIGRRSGAMADARTLSWQSGDGLALHAAQWGDEGAPPVICLHGLTRNARDFETFGPWLAGLGRRAIAADMRGRGRSAWDPQARYLLPTYAEDVLRLMDAARIDRAGFVGTSMGGLITMELALAAPDRIAAAVVNDVGPVLGEAGLTRIAAYVGKPVSIAGWDDAVAYVRHQNTQAFPGYGAAEWSAMARRLFREADGQVAPDYDPAIARPFAGGGAAAPRDPWAAWQALAAAAPVLLLRGALSDLFEPWVAARMLEGGRDVTLIEVPDVGHAPMLDEPAARDAIAAFLARLG